MQTPDTSNVYRANWSEKALTDAGYTKESKSETIERLTLAASASSPSP